jgi:hypothetical protein
MNSLAQRIKDHTINLYGYKKFSDESSATSKQTISQSTTRNITRHASPSGQAILVNEVQDLVVVDLDFKDKGDELVLSKLAENDVIVRTCGGGLHIYCNLGDFKAKCNRMIKCYRSDSFDVDLLTSVDPTSRSIVVLPESRVRKDHHSKVRKDHHSKITSYSFVRGGFDSVVERSVDEVLADLGIRIGVNEVKEKKSKSTEMSEVSADYIDLMNPFSINDIITNASNNAYVDDDEALITDLMKVVAFIPVSQIYVVKDYNTIQNCFKLELKNK